MKFLKLFCFLAIVVLATGCVHHHRDHGDHRDHADHNGHWYDDHGHDHDHGDWRNHGDWSGHDGHYGHGDHDHDYKHDYNYAHGHSHEMPTTLSHDLAAGASGASVAAPAAAASAPASAPSKSSASSAMSSKGGVKIVKPAQFSKHRPGPIEICMETSGYTVEPAKKGVNEGKGHHHIIIGPDLPSLNAPIPKNSTHIHMGDGSTCKKVDLGPGNHTVTALFAKGNHIPYNPAVKDTIMIYVSHSN